jgi:hypothetical protein
MSRETVPEKAVRYLGDGRLDIAYVGQGRVVASCRGDRGDVADCAEPSFPDDKPIRL